jgi:hypothetical protein
MPYRVDPSPDPLGLEAFHAELQRELVTLVGERYARTGR